MTKAFILFFLILGFSNTQFDQYTSGYNSDYSQYYPSPNQSESTTATEGVSPACAGAISNANRAFNQLIKDIRTQAPQWNIFTDFDAVDEVSYFIQSQCKPEDLDLVNKGEVGIDEEQDKACDELLALVLQILEQNTTSSFRGGFEEGIVISQKGKELGLRLGDNCILEVVPKNISKTESEGELFQTLLSEHSHNFSSDNLNKESDNSENQMNNSSIQIQLFSVKSNYHSEKEAENNKNPERSENQQKKERHSNKIPHDHWEDYGIEDEVRLDFF